MYSMESNLHETTENELLLSLFSVAIIQAVVYFLIVEAAIQSAFVKIVFFGDEGFNKILDSFYWFNLWKFLRNISPAFIVHVKDTHV